MLPCSQPRSSCQPIELAQLPSCDICSESALVRMCASARATLRFADPAPAKGPRLPAIPAPDRLSAPHASCAPCVPCVMPPSMPSPLFVAAAPSASRNSAHSRHRAVRATIRARPGVPCGASITAVIQDCNCHPSISTSPPSAVDPRGRASSYTDCSRSTPAHYRPHADHASRPPSGRPLTSAGSKRPQLRDSQTVL